MAQPGAVSPTARRSTLGLSAFLRTARYCEWLKGSPLCMRSQSYDRGGYGRCGRQSTLCLLRSMLVDPLPKDETGRLVEFQPSRSAEFWYPCSPKILGRGLIEIIGRNSAQMFFHWGARRSWKMTWDGHTTDRRATYAWFTTVTAWGSITLNAPGPACRPKTKGDIVSQTLVLGGYLI